MCIVKYVQFRSGFHTWTTVGTIHIKINYLKPIAVFNVDYDIIIIKVSTICLYVYTLTLL